LKFIGFSKDGKYPAFEKSGARDGAGGEYATTYYVGTVKNSFAAAPTVFDWTTRPDIHALFTNAFRHRRLRKKTILQNPI
jgi:predicted secreted protein